MPHKSTDFCIEKRVRIYDVKVAGMLDRIISLNNPKYKSFNTLIVEALKFGLPKILEDVEPQSTLGDLVCSESNRIISHTNRLYDKMENELHKLLASLLISHEMITTVLNEVEQILALNGVEMTEEMRQNFINNLPAPLDKQASEILKKLNKDN